MISSYSIRTNNGKVYPEQKDLTLRQNIYKECKENIQTDFANLKYNEILLDQAAIIIRSDSITTPLHMDLKYDNAYIKVHFEIEGDHFFKSNTEEDFTININKNQFNFFYLPKVDGTLSFYENQKKSVEIVVSEDYLRNTFKTGFDSISGSLGESIKNKEPFKLFDKSPSIPSELLLIVNDIVNCSFRKEIKSIYLESKVKEIFSYLFSQISDKNAHKPNIKLSKSEHEQILRIEQLLKEKLQKPHTIKELASLFGMNETKLKRNFKIITGKPIFSYLTDIRMEIAKNLLIDKAKNVSEVAYAVGYKNPQHFTSAFKRKFNYVPSDLRKTVQSASF